MQVRKRIIFSLVMIALTVQSCSKWFPPAWYSTIRTKHFNHKKYFLHASDTLWILPPSATVEIRYSRDTTLADKGLQEDEEGKQRSINYITAGLRRYLSEEINIKQATLNNSLQKILALEIEIMLKRFITDSLTTYRFNDALVSGLKMRGISKCLVTNLYWEYYSQKLFKESSHGRYINGHKRYPPFTAILIANGAVFDVNQNEVVFYKTNIEVPSLIAPQPYGYWGNGEEPLEHKSIKEKGQSYWINQAFKPVVNVVKRKIKKS